MAERVRILVVGGGVAGCAAVHRLLSAEGPAMGVDWVLGGAGASQLTSGALDAPADSGWEYSASFATHMGWHLPDTPAAVATLSGEIRPALGVDAAVLDLAPLAGAKLGLVDFGRPGFDAQWLARSFNETDWARRTQTRFFSLRTEPLQPADSLLSDYDFSELLDAPEADLQPHDASSLAGMSALLLGPYGALSVAAAKRSRRLWALPAGQTLSAPGGVAGARFDASRALLVDRVRAAGGSAQSLLVRQFGTGASGLTAQLSDGSEIAASGCILCTGAFVGGGLIVERDHGRLRASFDLPGLLASGLELDGAPLLGASADAGFDLTALGLGALDRVGLRVDSEFRICRGFYAAGDGVAGRDRTVMSAAATAVAATETLLRDLAAAG